MNEGSTERFAVAVITGIITAGMPPSSAAKIAAKVINVLELNPQRDALLRVFSNALKIDSVLSVWAERDRLYADFMTSKDKARFLQMIKGIGPVTAAQLVKMFSEPGREP